MAFVIDTNIVSELARPAPHPPVVTFLQANSDLLLSVIVFHELEYGVQLARDMEKKIQLQNFSMSLRGQFLGRIIEIDMAIAEAAARLRAFDKMRGRILAEFDALIAATAMVTGATLVTRNTRDFETLDVPLFNPWQEPPRTPETGQSTFEI